MRLKASPRSSSAALRLARRSSHSKRVPIVSATGSTRMGSIVGPKVAARFGRPILELGGNNAMIVAPSADLDMAVRAIVFSAVGTAGQRCTSLRRVIAHRSIRADLTHRLVKTYASLPIGDPRREGTLVGPLIDHAARDKMAAALKRAEGEGGKVHGGGTVAKGVPNGGAYVEPAIVEMPDQSGIVREETFAPILYTLGYDTLDEAIAIQNDVPQGLSSSIFTLNLREAEAFLSASGSDCGIANVNIGPSGAEIGGAFGGEKETGGRPRERLRRLEGLHAPADEHGELFGQAAARAGSEVRRVTPRRPTGPILGGNATPLGFRARLITRARLYKTEAVETWLQSLGDLRKFWWPSSRNISSSSICAACARTSAISRAKCRR